MSGEKPSKYFLNLQKIRMKNKTITHLITDDEREINSKKRFYEDLYAQDPPSSPLQSLSDLGLNADQVPRLSESSKNDLGLSIPLKNLGRPWAI